MEIANVVNDLTLKGLLEQAMVIRDQLAAAQVELTESEVTGRSANGLVEVTLRGTGEVTGIKIDPGAFDPRDPGELEELLMTAFRHAHDGIRGLAAEKAGRLTDLVGGSDDVPRFAR